MTDVLQQAMQQFAAQNTIFRDLTIFCGEYLVFVLCALWLIIVAISFRAVSLAFLVRLVLLGIGAFALSLVLGPLIVDPRPFVVAHQQPIIPISTDNGFPSDHTLLAAFLTVNLWWLRRRSIPLLAVGTILVALGRLGIAAHHTLDVTGSILIVLAVALVVGLIPLPKSWRRPLLPSAPAHPAPGEAATRA